MFEIPGTYPLLPEEVENRLRLATEIVANVSGDRPVSFRSPRLFGSTAVVNALEALGYATDASYPMYFYRERLVPYHPSADDWTKTGSLRVLELPNFADLSMDIGTREVRRGDRPIELTRTEFTLLELFLRRPRRVLERSFILEEVWGYDFPTTANSLEVYVGYLRRKTEAEGEPRLIHTVRGVGYVLRESPP